MGIIPDFESGEQGSSPCRAFFLKKKKLVKGGS